MGTVDAEQRVSYASLAEVSDQARLYPSHVLEGCETGLVLFAAAFLGHNDAIHFAEAGIATTCVDTDAERLEEMRAIYPEGWTFVDMDAWTYAAGCAALDLTFDVVSLDPFTGDAMDRALADLTPWTQIAARLVVFGAIDESDAEIPEGWVPRSSVVRAPGCYWHAIERA